MIGTSSSMPSSAIFWRIFFASPTRIGLAIPSSTSVWAALGAELEGIGGLYLEDCAQALPASEAPRMRGVEDYALDPVLADRLWALSQTATGA